MEDVWVELEVVAKRWECTAYKGKTICKTFHASIIWIRQCATIRNTQHWSCLIDGSECNSETDCVVTPHPLEASEDGKSTTECQGWIRANIVHAYQGHSQRISTCWLRCRCLKWTWGLGYKTKGSACLISTHQSGASAVCGKHNESHCKQIFQQPELRVNKYNLHCRLR